MGLSKMWEKNNIENGRCSHCSIERKWEPIILDNYHKRVYMDRVKPTRSIWITSMVIVAGIMFISLGIASCSAFISKSFTNADDKLFFGIAGLIGILIGLGSIKDAVDEHKAMKEYAKGTTTTKATVICLYKEIEDSPGDGEYGNSISYYIVVQFNAFAKQYIICATVSKSLYEKTDRSKIFRLTYANSNPCILLFDSEY